LAQLRTPPMASPQTYIAPLGEIGFILNDLFDAEHAIPPQPGIDASRGTVDAALSEAARFIEREIAPLNAVGDTEGCRWNDGHVPTPSGFRPAYAAFAAGGWSGLSAHPDEGGQGLPETVNLALAEMMSGANLAFGTYPGLSHAAYNALKTHGSAQLKALYLPKLASGAWTGTMCLTEPQCGTDLALVRTRAEPRAEGTFAITGAKIFITAGEHDLAENILHLVLARETGAPAGIRGLSLYLVPKYLPDVVGQPSSRNGVSCSRI